MAAAGVAVAGVALIKFGADSVKAFAESEDVIAQTEAVIKSTGGAAGYTASQIAAMATELEHLTTFSDEEVASAENLLLTFMNIGHEVLPQATKAVLDMSTALDQDLKSSSIQLGKALNDPITGLTALRRVGVAFTESQVKQITALAQSNDLLGAQKIILGELTKEFGGSAAKAAGTLTGKTQQLANSWDNFKESIGSFIAQVGPPVLDLLNKLVGALEAVGVATRDSATAAIEQFNLEPIVATIQEGTPKLAAYADTIALLFQEMSDSAFPRSMFIADLVDLNEKLHEAGMEGQLTAEDIHLLATGDYNAATATGTLSTAVKHLGDEVDSTGKKVHHFAGMTVDELTDFRSSVLSSVDASVGSLTSLGQKWSLTGAKAVAAMDAMATKSGTIARDFKELDTRAIPEKFMAFLKVQGPDAVHSYVGLNKQGAADMLKDWRTYQNNMKTIQDDLIESTRNSSTQIGLAITQGTKQGIEAGTKGVMDAAAAMAQRAIRAAMDALGANSPSEVMKDVGADFTIGFAQGIESKMGAVISAIEAVIGEGLSKARLRQAKELQALASDMAEQMDKMVARVQKDWDKLHDQIDTFKQAVQSGFDSIDLLGGAAGLGQKLHDDLVASVQKELDAAKLAEAPADIISALEDKLKTVTASTVVPTAADFKAYLDEQLKSAQDFAAALQQLQGLGLNQGLLSELASQGPGALPFLQALISGGKDVIAQFNDTQGIIDDIAKQTKDKLADDYFGDRLAKLGQEVADLQDQLEKMVARLADKVSTFIDGVRADAVGAKVDDVIAALDRLARRLDNVGSSIGTAGVSAPASTPGMVPTPAPGGTMSPTGTDFDYDRMADAHVRAFARAGGLDPRVLLEEDLKRAINRHIADVGRGRRPN